jgi:exopolysaccharide biosynthesis polyprenyl glycosylphosphotransferase
VVLGHEAAVEPVTAGRCDGLPHVRTGEYRAALARESAGLAPDVGAPGVFEPAVSSSRALPWGREAARLVAHAGRAAVVWLSVLVPYASQRPLTPSGVLAISLVAAIWVAALSRAFAAGYRTIGVGLPATIGSCTGLLAVAAVDPWFPGLHLGPWVLLGTTVGVFASAGAWEWCVQQTSVFRRRVLFVGTTELAEALAAELGRAGPSPFTLVGRVEEGQPTTAGASSCFGGLAELATIVEAQRPDLVVLADERTYAAAVDRLLDAAGTGFRLVGLSTFFEYAFGRVPLQHLTSAWFMAVLHLHQPAYSRWSKRTFDIVLGCVGLIVALPLLAVIALLVRRTNGPVLYRQTRLGEGGREFTLYKFRTMRCDAEEPGRARWAAECDERATTVGRFLRRRHLDELPQLWNVIKGEMSIVGPRPERPDFVAMLEAAVPFWTRRLLVKPGVTGWAQVRCGYAADCAHTAEKLSYDLWYIRHRRLSIDVAICVRTIGVVLGSLLPSRSAKPTRSTPLEQTADP